MKRAYIYGLFAVGLISVVVIVLFVFQPSNPVKRVAKEHGIHLPASATSVRCGGDAWKRSFIDCGATVSFEMPESDLPGLVGKLSVHTSSVGTGDWVAPGNAQYVVKAPWASGSPDVVYECGSTTGDFMRVGTWRLSGSRIGVLVYTDWN